MFDLTGKNALVTGASGGIGGAIARALHGAGATVALSGTRTEPLEALAQELGERVHVLPCNLSDLEAVDALPKQAAEAMGSVDILVNNAGAIPAGDIDAVDEARWREAWDLKVFGYINMTRAFLARMKERGHGVIINDIGSGGEKVDYGYIAGAAGNASLMAFTKAIAGHIRDCRVIKYSRSALSNCMLVSNST